MLGLLMDTSPVEDFVLRAWRDMSLSLPIFFQIIQSLSNKKFMK